MSVQPAYVALLERSLWLAPDGAELAPRLLQAGRLIHRDAGAWVHGEGDLAGGLLVVLEGTLDLFCHGIGERQVRIGQLGAGAAIGQSVRLGGGPRLVTAVAGAPSVILVVPDQALSQIALHQPQIWRAVATLLYGQLRYALQAQADLLTLPPLQRIAARLVEASRVHPVDDWLRLSQQALGEMTGLTRKTTNRVLKQLTDQGVLALGYRQIVVRDADKLLDIARRQTG